MNWIELKNPFYPEESSLFKDGMATHMRHERSLNGLMSRRMMWVMWYGLLKSLVLNSAEQQWEILEDLLDRGLYHHCQCYICYKCNIDIEKHLMPQNLTKNFYLVFSLTQSSISILFCYKCHNTIFQIFIAFIYLFMLK